MTLFFGHVIVYNSKYDFFWRTKIILMFSTITHQIRANITIIISTMTPSYYECVVLVTIVTDYLSSIHTLILFSLFFLKHMTNQVKREDTHNRIYKERCHLSSFISSLSERQCRRMNYYRNLSNHTQLISDN